ncbi:MAG: type II toxin-antitoxin system RelE/ParE family toxin [Burkholderiales bacterium]
MLTEFSDEDTQELFNSIKALTRDFGAVNAKLIRRRLDDLRSSATLEIARRLPGKLEELKGKRKGQFSMRLEGGSRLIFRSSQQPPPTKPDSGLDWTQVLAITVLKVEDYHD